MEEPSSDLVHPNTSSHLVHGNTSLHLRALFEAAGGQSAAEPMVVEVKISVSVSYIFQPDRIVPAHPHDGFVSHLPLSDLLSHRLLQLQVERMLSDINRPPLSDIDFWTEKIAAFANVAALTVVLEGYSGFGLFVDFTISRDPTDLMVDLVLTMAEDLREADQQSVDEALQRLLDSVRSLVLEEEEEEEAAAAAAGGTGDLGAVPASESSIKALESKTYQGDGKDGSTCAICSEDFEAGAELTIMPCSHEFHQACVINWLELSHTCPLCRYAMPTDADGLGRRDS